MTATAHPGADASGPAMRILLYSSDAQTRSDVMMAVGRRLAPGLPRIDWLEHATAPAVATTMDSTTVDILLLDGESQPVGGMGLCRQLKNEIFECPPIVLLTARPQDDWLAAWSQADAAISKPFDPITMANVVLDAVTPADA